MDLTRTDKWEEGFTSVYFRGQRQMEDVDHLDEKQILGGTKGPKDGHLHVCVCVFISGSVCACVCVYI